MRKFLPVMRDTSAITARISAFLKFQILPGWIGSFFSVSSAGLTELVSGVSSSVAVGNRGSEEGVAFFY